MNALVTSGLDFNDASEMLNPRRHDLEALRRSLRDHAEAVLHYLFPNGKRDGHRFLVGDVSGQPGKSLVVELEGDRRGLWIDFATGESGDLIDLWSAVHGYVTGQNFGALLDEIAAWLVLPGPRPEPVVTAKPDIDTLGAPAAKWDYLSTDGKLLACVYRYDTPDGKEYRPWNPAARNRSMPNPRPLYHLPEIAQASTVVLVEGEKCADALQVLGIATTTAMGGAAAPFEKTDWSPLTGKTVILWPDHDEVGQRYADALVFKLFSIGVKALRRIAIPAGKPAKWDSADAVSDGTDISGLLATATPVIKLLSSKLNDWHAIDRFTGKPQQRQWLVDGIFPLAQPSLIAAGGGVGKSFLLLSLAREVAVYDGTWLNAPSLFGGALASHGIAIYITAEDDAIEIHNRLNALGAIPPGLYVVPLPDAGGAIPLFAPDSATKAPATTPAWTDLERQFVAMANVKLLVLDPLQPLCALDLNVPENAQFVCSRLAALAATTGASVIVSHHFAKREVWTPEQAREAIRGTGGLVDGVRSVYALWPAREDDAKNILKSQHLPYQRGAVVQGGVVKANGRANLKVATFIRDARGLLCDRTAELQRLKSSTADLLPLLKQAIANAVIEGKPYIKTGVNGVYGRRFEMPEALHNIGKHTFVMMVDTLLATGEIVQAMADNSKSVKWLDVPEGKVAKGDPDFRVGHIRRGKGSQGAALEAKNE